MEELRTVLAGLGLPLLGTTAGAAMVFCLKDGVKESVQKLMMGFASGVMMAAAVWSLLLPAIDMAEAAGGIRWLPAVAGFLAGAAFLQVLDAAVARLHPGGGQTNGWLLPMVALVLHNIPEGMAVGVALAGMLAGQGVTAAGALALATGIAIQNFPEGAVVSVPLLQSGVGRGRAFWYGFLSGAVEPVGAAAMLLLTALLAPLLPYVLAFAAGTMICVVVAELIPEAQEGEGKARATMGAAAGFALMMLLDVALG